MSIIKLVLDSKTQLYSSMFTIKYFVLNTFKK